MTVFLNLHILCLQSTCLSPWPLCVAEIINPLLWDTAIPGATLVRLLQGAARKEGKLREVNLTGCFYRLCFSSTDCDALYKRIVFINSETDNMRKGRLKDFPFKKEKSE